jgi:hypothetical protein
MDWTTIAVATSLLLILGAPMATARGVTWGLTENLFVRLALVFYVVMNIRLGALPGLLSLLAVFSLYIERSYLLLTTFPNQQPKGWIIPQYGSATTTPLPFEEPKGDDGMNYEPEDEKGLSVVEKHGEVTEEVEFEKTHMDDSNPRLEEGPQGSDEGTAFFEEHGLA